jgi:hypothetical protein
MPTARELLEQADALMRRNRMGTSGDAAGRPATPGTNPPTLSPTSGPTRSPRPIQREPIAPSVARTSLPVDPTESPVFTSSVPAVDQPAPQAPFATEEPVLRAPVVMPDAQSATEAEAEFPLLTDAVDEASAATPPLDDVADDVPLLTDAVEEIDVGIVDEAARGEPSIWELTVRGETSVLGPAPDSIVVVPPHDAATPVVPQSPPRGRDPLGLDQPPDGYARPDPTDAKALEPVDRAEGGPASEGAGADSGEFEQRPPPQLERTEPYAPPSTSTSEDSRRVDADEPQPTFSAFIADSAPEDAEEEAVAAVGLAAESPVAAEPSGAEWLVVAQPSAGESPGEFTAAEPTLPSELDQKQIREIAEEIGMQVLQRIDIFTDTTLRAQLGERLRPVVDRAAHDLVAAINEHVGELLRAQVSEAIEREIESWKRGR